VSQQSRRCGILDISQPYRPAWPVTGKALLYLYLKLQHVGTDGNTMSCHRKYKSSIPEDYMEMQ
jgi:hypothetical protein